MKHILTKRLRFLNGIGSFLLMLLGFGCSAGVEEYGTPYATFQIKGRVGTANQEGIPNIQLASIFGENDTSAVTKTETDGSFEINFSYVPLTDLKIAAEDVDGDKNGSYLPTVQEIHLTEKDFRGGDGNWYAGEVEKEITISLKEKEKHETAD